MPFHGISADEREVRGAGKVLPTEPLLQPHVDSPTRGTRARYPAHFRENGAIPLGKAGRRVPIAPPMGHCKGKDNVRKRAARRKKNARLVLAKSKATAAK